MLKKDKSAKISETVFPRGEYSDKKNGISKDDSESTPSMPSSFEDVQLPTFTLSSFRTWKPENLNHGFQNYISKLGKKRTIPIVGVPKLSKVNDFTPWWDEFSQPFRQSSVKVDSTKDADLFDNWFDKSHSQSGHSSWLCGPGSSNVLQGKSVQQVAMVEDIEVPSIYNQAPKIKGRRALKRDRKAEREKTLSKKWFQIRAPEVDDNTRMDMDMIRMRGVLDPKRFYKHNDRGALPKYFQMGTVVDEGTDFYSSRLTKKQRKQTLVEELMADANIRQFNKRKYSEVQQKMRNKKFKGKKFAAS